MTCRRTFCVIGKPNFRSFRRKKNRSGQRTYRRRDVEIALRIKELLYEDLYTIAGAKKKLQVEMRESTRLKIVRPEDDEPVTKREFPKPVKTPSIADAELEIEDEVITAANSAEEFDEDIVVLDDERREALKSLASQLLELREMLKSS